MKLRFLVPALALALTTLAAHAQVGIYVYPIASIISDSQADTGPFAFLGDGQTQQVFGGVVFGGYFEVAHESKTNISLDVRDTIQHGNTASFNSFMVGPRLAWKPLVYGLKPYVQFGVAAGRTKAPVNLAHIERLEVAGLGGVDKRLTSHVDWRIVEISYGSVSAISSQTFLFGAKQLPNVHALGFSTGFVFRFK